MKKKFGRRFVKVSKKRKFCRTGLQIYSSDDYIQILTQNYEVVVFNSLTKESLEKVLIAINKVEFSSELKNGQPSVKQSIEETDIKKNKKCGIF